MCSHRSRAEHDTTLPADSATATRGNAAAGLALLETAGGAAPSSGHRPRAHSPTPSPTAVATAMRNKLDELAQRQHRKPSELLCKAVVDHIHNALRLNTR